MTIETDKAWDALVKSCIEWANHMDQWEKFKFNTEFGTVYVSIMLETEYPDSFDLINK
jgi:hypothetical protein